MESASKGLVASLIVLSGTICFGIAALVYGEIRVLHGHIGFCARGSGFALVYASVAVSVFLFLLVSFLRRSLGKRARWSLVVVAIIIILMASCMLECIILADEMKFVSEALQRSQESSEQSYSRSRAWPHRGYGLHYVPGRGMHTTD